MKKTDKLVITSANVFSRFIYSLIVLNEKYFIRRTSFAIDKAKISIIARGENF